MTFTVYYGTHNENQATPNGDKAKIAADLHTPSSILEPRQFLNADTDELLPHPAADAVKNLALSVNPNPVASLQPVELLGRDVSNGKRHLTCGAFIRILPNSQMVFDGGRDSHENALNLNALSVNLRIANHC